MVKLVWESKQRMDVLLLQRKNWLLHLLMRHRSTKLRLSLNTWVVHTLVLVQTSMQFFLRQERMFKFITLNIWTESVHSWYANKLLSFSKNILRVEVLDLSVLVWSLLDGMSKMVHKSSNWKPPVPSTAGKLLLLVEDLLLLEAFWKRDIPTISTLKMPFTQQSLLLKTLSKVKWLRKT